MHGSGREYTVIGVDTCRDSGKEGPANNPANRDAHGPAVEYGGGTFAGLLHRNVIACGFVDTVHVFISSSPRAADFFADGSLAWVHLDARHDYDSVAADIDAWAPKVKGVVGSPVTTTTASGRASSALSVIGFPTPTAG